MHWSSPGAWLQSWAGQSRGFGSTPLWHSDRLPAVLWKPEEEFKIQRLPFLRKPGRRSPGIGSFASYWSAYQVPLRLARIAREQILERGAMGVLVVSVGLVFGLGLYEASELCTRSVCTAEGVKFRLLYAAHNMLPR